MPPSCTICFTSAGSSSRRIRLATVERSIWMRDGQLFLRALVLIDVPLERLGLFDRVEILALDVFDDGQLGHLAVVDVANLHGHLAPVGGLGGAEPALAGDQFEAVADAADDEWLQNAVRANAVGQIGDLGFVERLPRLVRDCARSRRN